MRICSRLTALALAAGLALTAGSLGAQVPGADAELIKRARAIHDKVMTLDTHVDINPGNFVKYKEELTSQVSIPKMRAGGLDAAFFIVYVGQGDLAKEGYDNAYKQAVAKFDAIHRLTKEIAPDEIGLALTSADARRLHKEGKKVAFIGVENGYPLGDESTAVARVREFHERGARYLSLAHNGHSQLADSNNGEASGTWLHNGLSPLGRQVVEELNRLGILIDISHPSKQANLQTLALSKAPVIASHSSARALWNHSRNLDDEELEAVKQNGGVVQTVAFASYVKVNPPSPERAAAQAALRKELGLAENAPLGGRGGGRGGRGGAQAQLTEEERAALQKRTEEIRKRAAELDAKFPPPPRASISDFVDHIDYLVKKIGIDHVGISSDFDGGGGVEGWMDATETFNVTLELVRRGYTEEQIEKIWSGNLLRALDQAQKVAAELQKS